MKSVDIAEFNRQCDLLAEAEWQKSRNEKTIADRKWQSGLKPAKPQLACDHGLFGDEHLQLDLIEMFQEPLND